MKIYRKIYSKPWNYVMVSFDPEHNVPVSGKNELEFLHFRVFSY